MIFELITAQELPQEFKDKAITVSEGSNKELDAILKEIDPIYKKYFNNYYLYSCLAGAEPCFGALEVDNLIYFEVERIHIHDSANAYFEGYAYFKVTKTTIL